jgi:hypothetical protein
VKKALMTTLIISSIAVQYGCQSQPNKKTPTILHSIKETPAKIQKVDALYLVERPNSLYVFDDRKTFLDFLQTNCKPPFFSGTLN